MATSMVQGMAVRARLIGALVTAGLVTSTFGTASGIDVADTLRKIARVADDVPISKLDDAATEAASSRFARELVEKAGGRIDDVADRSRVLRKLLAESIDGLPPSLVKQIDALDGVAEESMAVLGRGSKAISRSVPDIAERSRLIADGGADALMVVGRYDDLADDAVKFSVAARAGRLPSVSGGSLTMKEFSDFFIKQGNRGKYFWDKYVRPNWKYWVGTAALAAILATPDEYLDAAGDLLEGAVDKVARVGGRALGIALKAAGTVAEQTLWHVFCAFVSRPLGVVVVAAGSLVAVGLAYRPLRDAAWLFLRPVRRSRGGRRTR